MITGHNRKRNGGAVNWTTTLGLVVHAAADGIALGAAAATKQLDVEIIVFLAIMLHKAPAAFGLVTFLLHEGLDRNRVRKHLLIFSVSAPVLALLTFIGLSSGGAAVDDKVIIKNFKNSNTISNSKSFSASSIFDREYV